MLELDVTTGLELSSRFLVRQTPTLRPRTNLGASVLLFHLPYDWVLMATFLQELEHITILKKLLCAPFFFCFFSCDLVFLFKSAPI
jgi:hypothetical protein